MLLELRSGALAPPVSIAVVAAVSAALFTGAGALQEYNLPSTRVNDGVVILRRRTYRSSSELGDASKSASSPALLPSDDVSARALLPLW